MSEQTFITKNKKETQKIGEEFAKKITNGQILAFFGDLGSGKTTFIQGFSKGLGIKRRIISPTFIIVRKYDINDNNFFHVDLYRVETENDIKSVGLDQIMEDGKSIVAIEWSEKLGKLLPKKRIEIHIDLLENEQRKIRFINYE